MSNKNFIQGLIFASLTLAPFMSIAASQMVSIVAGADNTLYEDADGSVSNGSGAILLAGRNNVAQDSIRRAVLYFDVAGNLPHGARVESAVLTLYMDRGNGGLRDMRLHRLLADWGEGDSAGRVHLPRMAMLPGCTAFTLTPSGARMADALPAGSVPSRRLETPVQPDSIRGGVPRVWSTTCGAGCVIRRRITAGSWWVMRRSPRRPSVS